MPVRGVGYALIALSALGGAAMGVVSRLVFDGGWSPRDLAAARVVGAALVLGPVVGLGVRRLSRRDLGSLVLFGLVGIVLAQWLFYEAIARQDIAVTLVIVFLAPALIALYQRVVHGDRLPTAAVAGIAVAVAGVTATALGGAGSGGGPTPVGLAAAIGTMLAYAGQVVMASRMPAALSPATATGGAMLVAGVIWLVVHPLWTWPLGALPGATSLGPATDRTAPLAVLVLAVALGTALIYCCLVVGAGRVGAGAASVVGMLEPAFAGLLAWVLLRQSLSVVQLLGIAAALGGIAVVEFHRVRRPLPPRLGHA